MRNSNLLPVKANGRGAVAVGRILRNGRQRGYADDPSWSWLISGVVRIRLTIASRMACSSSPMNMETMAGGASFAPKRWSLPADATEHAQQVLIFVHSLDNRSQEQQELRVFARRPAGLEQVFARVRGKRPVVVLARAVDALERLFVQQADKAMRSARPAS